MGELKALGSEKLKGDEKVQRILELTYYQSNDNLKESKENSVESTKEGKTGIYGIEREKDGYYVKKGLNENSLEYIGGMFMKNKNKFSSYNEALKKMEFLIEQELAESEILEEATKYVLKQAKPAAPPVAPAAEEPVAPPPAPVAAEPSAEPEAEAPLPGDEAPEDGGENPDDYMKVLKKLAGKFQEKFSKYEDKLESSDYTEILKQILSGIDLENIEESDIEEIISVFEDDDIPSDDMGDAPPVPAEDGVEPMETTETDDIDGIASLDELINTPLDDFDEFEDEEDERLATFDDSFLDDEEIGAAERLAKKDQIDDTGSAFSNIDSFPEYKGGGDSDIDEQLPIQGMGEFDGENQGMGPISGDEELGELIKFYDDDDGNYKPKSNKSGDWEDLPPMKGDEVFKPIDSDVNAVSGEASDDGEVKELDLDELTNMVNSSIKHTLGKYFE